MRSLNLQLLPLLLRPPSDPRLDELCTLHAPKREVRFTGEELRLDEGSFVLYANGQQLDKAARVELLSKLRGGEVPPVLEVEAVTYLQRDTPNRRYVRFADKILAAFAKSFVGQPFLRDHNQWELDARGGTITSSKLEKLEDGTKVIRMKLSLVKSWAIEGVLDGTIDRFSIGWSRTDVVLCSVHKTEVFTKCDCMPGQKLGDQVVQFIFTGAEGTEVSAVNVPAVVGTAVQAISQLDHLDRDTLAGILAGDSPPARKTTMIPAEILAALGLKPDATLAEVLAAIASRSDELTILRSTKTQLSTELTELRTSEAKRVADATKVAVEASISQLLAAGKIKPGSDVEQALRRTAGRDMDIFSAQVKEMLGGPSVTPVGSPTVVDTKDPVPPTKLEETPQEPKEFLSANPETAKWLNKAGLSKEQVEKHSRQAISNVAATRAAAR